MSEKKFEPAFIPCGDSMEKMGEISDELLESISGGSGTSSKGRCCPACGTVNLPREITYGCIDGSMNVTEKVGSAYVCSKCGEYY